MTFPVLAIAVLSLGAAFAFLFHRLASRLSPEAAVIEWLDGFSMENYAPMARLFDPGDFAFLERQKGYYPALGKRLRAERRQAFIGYLGLMIRDFNQLLRIGRLMQVRSSVDRPEFARALSRQQIRFYFAVCVVRCRLELAPLGFPVEGAKLLESLGRMFHQVRELALVQNEAF